METGQGTCAWCPSEAAGGRFSPGDDSGHKHRYD